jgi:LmbE family N-acetylglucosaminyl deacetylase
VATIIAVSPTLADAVQSVGGTLARHASEGHDVVIICTFGDEADADAQVTELLGLAGIVYIGLPEASERGYGEAEREGFHGIHEGDHDTPNLAGTALAVALSRLNPELILSPLGLTGHIDSVIVHAALQDLAVPRLRWLDLPYGLARTPGATLGDGELLAVPVGDQLEAKLAACALFSDQGDALRAHAAAEGDRLGAGEPVELLLRPSGD